MSLITPCTNSNVIVSLIMFDEESPSDPEASQKQLFALFTLGESAIFDGSCVRLQKVRHRHSIDNLDNF